MRETLKTFANSKMLNPEMPNHSHAGETERMARPCRAAIPSRTSKRWRTSLEGRHAVQFAAGWTYLLVAAVAVLECQSQDAPQTEPMAANEISRHSLADHQAQREVTNLRLLPDLRAIRLRWDYELHQEAGATAKDIKRPASFRIRFCELTSWQAEIKCRQRDLQVAEGDAARANDAPSPQQQQHYHRSAGQALAADEVNSALQLARRQSSHNNNNNSTVIFGQQEQVRVVAISEPAGRQHLKVAGGSLAQPPGGGQSAAAAASGPVVVTYEAQIHDLRALTNYTFAVRVLRFAGQPAELGLDEGVAGSRGPTRPGRRLDLGALVTGNELQPPSVFGAKQAPGRMRNDEEFPTTASLRVETKPFSAEALKCLANSSEVLVNTGRFFGGRISVEGSSHPRCHLLGNKSSPQTSYLFRIDHELCRSRLLDSQRIESMILVHENKDILTHNTARFLVQCNISQRSFTVRASVSLPKVNPSLVAPGGLPSSGRSQHMAGQSNFRPATITALASPREHVRLGSMPGVYRLVRANEAQLGETTASVPARSRQSKELQQQVADESAGRALVLANPSAPPPAPVDVSSGILFVDRPAQVLTASEQPRESRLLAPPAEAHEEPRRAFPSQQAEVERTATSTEQQPVVMTNNHRVAGDFLPLAQAVADLERRPAQPANGTAARTSPQQQQPPDSATPEGSFSIKYSPMRVAEYSLAKMVAREYPNDELVASADTPTAVNAAGPAGARSRSGRMRQIGPSTSPRSSTTSSTTTAGPTRLAAGVPTSATPPRAATPNQEFESRMGESRQRGSSSSSAAALANETQPAHEDDELASSTAASGPPTVAQNLTGALIRWSLKTLGNLARKSLDALASEAELAARANMSSDEEQPPTGGPPRPRENLLDGFVVENNKLPAAAGSPRTQPVQTTKRPQAGSAPSRGRQASTSTTVSQASPAAATQSADLEQSRAPHTLGAPPAPKQTTGATTSGLPGEASTASTAARPGASARPRPAELRARLEREQQASRAAASLRAKLHSPGGENASLLPENEPSQRSVAQETGSGPASSSLWPIYVLWSLVGLVGLVALVGFLVVSSRGHAASSLAPNSHHHHHRNHSNHRPPRGQLGILAQLNDAIYRHRASNTNVEAARGQANESIFEPHVGLAKQPPPQLPPPVAGLLCRQATGSVASFGVAGVQSPSVQRRELAGVERHPVGQRHFVSVISPGGPRGASSEHSPASTRSTSAASTANISAGPAGSPENSTLDHRLRAGTTGTSTMRRSVSELGEENYCKNHEQFVHTDYLLLSDSDCLANECGGSSGRESFA